MVVSEALDYPQQQDSSFTGIPKAIPEPISEPFLPEINKPELKRWKCHNCYTVLKDSQLVEGKCPVCHESRLLERMCSHDRICTCFESVQSGVQLCPVCDKPTCQCGSHSVVVVSRVTGYLSDTSGWNLGKRAEFLDRVRVTLQPNGEMLQTKNQLH